MKYSIEDFQDCIKKNHNKIWKPPLKLNTVKCNTNSWFDLLISETKTKNKFIDKTKCEEIEKVKYKDLHVRLLLTFDQKKIINSWIEDYRQIYNLTLKYIKTIVNKDMTLKQVKEKINFYKVRMELYNCKHEIFDRNNSTSYVNDIDQAINLACKNYKVAHKLYKLKKIKHFRMRPWRKQKASKYMDISHERFGNNKLKRVGEIKTSYNGEHFPLEKLNHWCKLIHKDNSYILCVPQNIIPHKTCMKVENKIEKQKVIALDPGVRTFMTGISESGTLQLANNLGDIIEPYLKRKDKILGNENVPNNIKKKNELMINRKIKNKINDLHWKSINYLVNNYETVLVGNMSSKSVSSKKKSLNKMSKRVLLSSSLFKFRLRLKYKCDVKRVNYKVVNEWNTSLTCSCCANIKTKDELGSNKIYDCNNCKSIMDRDINASRNILFKCL